MTTSQELHDSIDSLTRTALKVKRDRDQLLTACKRLLKFTDELCDDVDVSKHYPSAEFARKAIAQAESDD